MSAALSFMIDLLGTGSAIALSGSPGEAAVLAVVAAVGLLAMTLAVRATSPVAASALHPAAVRRRAERTVYLQLCDPDSPGRPMPRAPGARHRAA